MRSSDLWKELKAELQCRCTHLHWEDAPPGMFQYTRRPPLPRGRTRWSGISWLAWERFKIPSDVLEVAGKRNVWASLLRLLHIWKMKINNEKKSFSLLMMINRITFWQHPSTIPQPAFSVLLFTQSACNIFKKKIQLWPDDHRIVHLILSIIPFFPPSNEANYIIIQHLNWSVRIRWWLCEGCLSRHTQQLSPTFAVGVCNVVNTHF